MTGVLGRKIGMTQIFRENGQLVPVTAIDLAGWYVIGTKTQERDGYVALQVGLPAKKYQKMAFSPEWIKQPNRYFSFIKEVPFAAQESAPTIGAEANFAQLLQAGEHVNASGTTKGRGFQGVVKRHGFSGGPASHGPRFGRWPGSLAGHRSQGHVAKGKKLPGHMGVDRRSVLNLEIIKVEPENNVVFVKGSMPGHAGSLVFLRKSAR
jgi:large subunit ribosomal protein L3